MTDIIISEARDEDAEIILEHLKIVGAETDNLTFGSEGIGISRDEEAAFLERVAEDPHSVFYCAWKGSELVGTMFHADESPC